MKKDKRTKLKKGCRGFTLVEVIVAVAILAMASLVLVAAFNSSLRLFQRGVDMETFGDQAFARAETETETGGSQDSLSFSVEGTMVTVRGSYGTFEEGQDPRVSFTLFAPAEAAED
ncbi:MAG: prepilin-type N-terminal cleavage/methylation domain-containing protein [Bacillota bacterium]|nr:prepilin-type N-terminal cleavage/methylation domain-containing protein [Bacillota bacterium]